ncbi:5'-nucleotidase/2',3'-cyclic phosphodiesterase-like hydrolase [Halobacteroides halobius DSM 5150]|uniref:5'-nucleotidase/2',3'-cyclic phosphodiesterase-like hydrolase n=1 Tax=Halobacteroides halobius (strain ATCC 35273 / DSM 5150 / MD-1) TaxID=748449 RepID=L0K712_HALHC|nr:5'-nucleotidase C-terminal domain-containing protein [Halobacteroides halobius]AGB41077.1 5'-nucleotidase/2',3'-cyclic phosphodiesterase-like hydrolase [Halobacteroides halobius DSM 5150]
MKKRLSTVFLVLLVLCLVSSVALAKTIDLTIFHTNDTHAHVEEGKYAGMGFAKIATIVKQARKEVTNVLLLDAGDTFHGTSFANLNEGKSIAKIYNKLGYDVLVPGNHDFNYGHHRLAKLNKMTEFPIISANIVKADNQRAFRFQPGEIKNINGVKVAILGLTTPETTYKTHPKNVAGLEFKDPIKTAKGMVNLIKKKSNPDLIIALTHLGLSEGSKYTSKRLAQEVPGIDLIVDGHSHTKLEKGKLINNTPIVMAGEYTESLGVVNLTIKDGKLVKGRADLITKEEAANVKKDKKMLQLIADIKAKNKEITSTVIGKTAVKLNGAREDIRTGETNLGDLVANAMLEAVVADIAITNSGGIRASIPQGKITKGEVLKVLPFNNYVIVKKVKGRVILEAIEHGISKYPAHEGLFPQVAGLSFMFNPSQPAGKRGLALQINDNPIDPDQYYKVAINDFMAAGGDGYRMFKEAKTIQEAGSLDEIVIDYIKERGVVALEQDGRIIPIEREGNHYEYTIKWGDTLSELSLWLEIKMSKLIKLNKIKNPDLIYAGDKLILPSN